MKAKRISWLLLAAALGLTAQTAHSASITVDAGGNCTLGEAITAANNDNAAGNGCVSGSGADTITLQTDVSLSAPLPPMASAITIEGGGKTINGNNNATVGTVLNVAAIGSLTLREATVTGANTTNTGGGIYNGGITSIVNSTVSGNTADAGGGIFNEGTLTLTNCTVSGNTANYAGGIQNYAGTVTLTHTTVVGNTASSGAGGGIMNFENLTLKSCLISGNSASSEKELFNNGIVIASHFNVFGHSGENNTQAFSNNFTPGASDVNATSSGTNKPLASILKTTLADNSGATKTHALPPGSPAINLDTGACDSGIAEDQRGYSRPIGNGCDSGAFEALVLPANTWLMTAPPCQPVPTDITSQYNSDIPGGFYNTNWTSYVWEASEQRYVPFASVMNLGTGNWLYSTIPATLTVTGTATPTEPCSNYGSGLSGNCFAIDLTPPPNNSLIWQIVGHPFPYSVNWADVRVATYNGSTWAQYTPSQAKAANLIQKEMWRWTGSTYEVKDDVTSNMLGVLQPQESIWVRILLGSKNFSTINNINNKIKLLIPAR